MRMCTSRAPAARTILTIFRLVVPRDRVVDQHHSLALENAPHGVELHTHTEVAIDCRGSMNVRPT
jgi:hypothetical protein